MSTTEERLTALETALQQIGAERQALRRRLRAWQGLAGSVTVAALLAMFAPVVIAQGQGQGPPNHALPFVRLQEHPPGEPQTGHVNVDGRLTATSFHGNGAALVGVQWQNLIGPAQGDLAGLLPTPVVAGLQGRAVSSAAPAAGNVLAWNAGASQWEPAAPPSFSAAAGGGLELNNGAFSLATDPDSLAKVSGGHMNVAGSSIGVGTGTPGAKLDVRGNIALGSDGDLRALAGVDNLRIIRGRLGADGTVAGLGSGEGFTAVHDSVGRYVITFDQAFRSNTFPVVTATTFGALSREVAIVHTIGASQISIRTFNLDDGSLTDSSLMFQVIGLR